MLRINRIIFIFYASENQRSQKKNIYSLCIIEDQWNILVSFLHSLMNPPPFSLSALPLSPHNLSLGCWVYCTYHHSTQVFCCEALKYFPYSSSSICQSNHRYPATEDNQINHLIITVNLFIYTTTCHPLPLYNVTF